MFTSLSHGDLDLVMNMLAVRPNVALNDVSLAITVFKSRRGFAPKVPHLYLFLAQALEMG